ADGDVLSPGEKLLRDLPIYAGESGAQQRHSGPARPALREMRLEAIPLCTLQPAIQVGSRQYLVRMLRQRSRAQPRPSDFSAQRAAHPGDSRSERWTPQARSLSRSTSSPSPMIRSASASETASVWAISSALMESRKRSTSANRLRVSTESRAF